MADEHVDYRFLLANERTFLAYLRTALSLQVAGLAVLQFLTKGHSSLRLTLGGVSVGRPLPTAQPPVCTAPAGSLGVSLFVRR